MRISCICQQGFSTIFVYRSLSLLVISELMDIIKICIVYGFETGKAKQNNLQRKRLTCYVNLLCEQSHSLGIFTENDERCTKAANNLLTTFLNVQPKFTFGHDYKSTEFFLTFQLSGNYMNILFSQLLLIKIVFRV